MQKREVTTVSIIGLISVFLLGNLIISFPKGYGSKYSIYGFLLCIAFAFIAAIAYIYIQSKLPEKLNFKSISEIKWLNISFTVIFIIFAAVCYSACTGDYIHMVDKVRLPQTPALIIAVVYIALSVFLGLQKKRCIYAFVTVAFAFTALAIIVMLILALDKFDIKLFLAAFRFNANYTVRQGISFYLQSFGQMLFVILFIGALPSKKAKKLQLSAVSVSGGLFLICLICTVALIGVEVINQIDFPYAHATGIINSSRDYTRLDIMTYYIFFVTSLIKSSVIYRVTVKAVATYSKGVKYFVSAALPILALTTAISRNLSGFFGSDIFGLILLGLEILIPIAFLIMIRKNYSPE